MNIRAVGSAIHWSAQLRELIKTTEPLGSFGHHKKLSHLPQMLPHVTVEGLGRLGFPMLDVVVDSLIATSTKAKIGHDDNTMLNADVGNTRVWQMDAAKITIGGGEAWSTYFTETVRNHCFGLGISSERFDALGIQANLVSLNVYDEGGHGCVHRDYTTDVNVFGSLLIQLPTSDGFTGGELTLTHNGVTKNLDLSIGSDNEFHTVAFYSNCASKFLPTTSGKRVCLVYNLITNSQSMIPSHDDNIEIETKLQIICDDWKKQGIVSKIGHQLENEYTNEDIGCLTLKGRDEIAFSSLSNSKSKSGTPLFQLSLLLMEEHQDSMEPFKLIQKSMDGAIEEKYMEDKDAWDMKCYTTNEWWVLYSERHGVYDNENDDMIIADDNGKKDVEDIDEDDIYDYDDDNVSENRRMFLRPCGYVTEYISCCDDMFSMDIKEYACAIIISPFAG